MLRAAPIGLRGLEAENVVEEGVGVAAFLAVVGVEPPEWESMLLPGRELCWLGGVVRRDFVTSLTRDVDFASLRRDFLSDVEAVRREKTPPLGDLPTFDFSGVGGSAALSLTYFDDVVRAGVSGVSSCSSLSGVLVIVRLLSLCAGVTVLGSSSMLTVSVRAKLGFLTRLSTLREMSTEQLSTPRASASADTFCNSCSRLLLIDVRCEALSKPSSLELASLCASSLSLRLLRGDVAPVSSAAGA